MEDRGKAKIALNKLVYAKRFLFESLKNTEFCGKLHNDFRFYIVDKSKRLEPINFHLLRQLSWQLKEVDPLFCISAAMFEWWVNRLLTAPLTAQLLCRPMAACEMHSRQNGFTNQQEDGC